MTFCTAQISKCQLKLVQLFATFLNFSNIFVLTSSRNFCHFFGSILMNFCRNFAKMLRKGQHLSSFRENLQNRMNFVGNIDNSSEIVMKLLSGPRADRSLALIEVLPLESKTWRSASMVSRSAATVTRRRHPASSRIAYDGSNFFSNFWRFLGKL